MERIVYFFDIVSVFWTYSCLISGSPSLLVSAENDICEPERETDFTFVLLLTSKIPR